MRSVSARRGHLAANVDGGTCGGHPRRFRRRCRPWLLPGIPDTADSAPHPAMACVRVRPLQEPVAGAAAAGRMQPTLVGATEPGGQAAAELAADIGHRWPGERAGLLKAQVVDLQPGDLAVTPAADDRLGDLLRVDADRRPSVLGQARSSTVRSATNTSLPGSRSGWPVSSS